jgi:hypothetical protein
VRDRQARPLLAAEIERVKSGAAAPCTTTPNAFEIKCQRETGHPGCHFAGDEKTDMRWSDRGKKMSALYPAARVQ